MDSIDDVLLLFVDPDDALQRSVTAQAVGTGIRVVTSEHARRALNLGRAISPAVIVTELELEGEEDGIWLASKVRSEPSLELTPVVLVTRAHALDTRLRALANGVDIIVNKPVDASAVLAQVRALGAMAGRIRDRAAVSSILRRPTPDEPPNTVPRAPLQGDLAIMPATTIFTILELDQMSGVLEMPMPDGARLLVHLASGFVSHGERGGTRVDAGEAVRSALAPRKGQFEFRSTAKVPAPAGAMPTTRYIWAAIDEAAKSSIALMRLADNEGPAEDAPAKEPSVPPPPLAVPKKIDLKSTLVSPPTITEMFPPGAKASDLVKLATIRGEEGEGEEKPSK